MTKEVATGEVPLAVGVTVISLCQFGNTFVSSVIWGREGMAEVHPSHQGSGAGRLLSPPHFLPPPALRCTAELSQGLLLCWGGGALPRLQAEFETSEQHQPQTAFRY